MTTAAPWMLTANEPACVTGVPLRQVAPPHRLRLMRQYVLPSEAELQHTAKE